MFTIILLIVARDCYVKAQSASLLMGARSAGLGYTSACLADHWSILNNVGGLAEVKKTVTAVSYNNHVEMKSFDRSAALIAVPFATSCAGLSVFRFGDE
ncbi:MAG TPA: hypothetical protein VEB86_06545, partial [Chryseosolibacter sp.]|nr:hypothetical protein [Chryseosolibacter sp.]